MAGLTAGRELKRAGYNVEILEASHRVGGRVFTMREPFSVCNLSHDDLQNTIFTKLFYRIPIMAREAP
mgnify:FL=1